MKTTNRMRYLVMKEEEYRKLNILTELTQKRVLKSCLKWMSDRIRIFYLKLDNI